MHDRDGRVAFLSGYPPFDGLDEAAIEALADAADTVDATAGDIVLDAFVAPSREMFVVVTGRVELWNTTEFGAGPDEVLSTGGVFGYSATLARAAVGPRARALGPTQLIRIPASSAAAAFSSSAGVRFLARNFTTSAIRATAAVDYDIVDQLIVTEPVLAPAYTTVTEVAALMTERNSGFAVVVNPAGSGRYGLVTDTDLRIKVLAAGLPPDTTTVDRVMTHPAATVISGTLAAQALLELTERHLECLLVVDRSGALRGLVTRDDFIVSPSTAGVSLREQIVRSSSTAQLATLARRVPALLGDLLRRGRSAGEVTTVHSTVIDAMARRALALVMADHPELDPAEVTWLALGSNGRREPVFSSDIDAAVVFADTVASPERQAAYRNMFDEVEHLLGRCGLRIDLHGAVPGKPLFSRTGTEWREAAQRWIDSPLDDNGMMMTSLLMDARPIHGDPALPVVNAVFGDIHRRPGTMRLLLAESLSHRARLRSMRDVLARRGGTFDIKTHALRPVIDIARWAALSCGSTELSTAGRLAAAAGSPMVPVEQADILIDVYERLQKIRLRYQLGQLERHEQPSDVLSMRRLSPLDRSLIAQAVREIATVQRRMANIGQAVEPENW